MRYRGQGHEIAVPLPARLYRGDDAGELLAAFEEAYRRLYSRIIPGVEVEVLSWVLLVSAARPRSRPRRRPPCRPRSRRTPARRRPVFDPETGEFVEVAIHERAALVPGATSSPGPPSSSRTRPRPSSAATSTRASTRSAISNWCGALRRLDNRY